MVDSIYIISQIFALVAFIFSLVAFHRSKKENILKTSVISNVFDIAHYLLLNAYSGMLTKVLALFRNIFVLFKDKRKKQYHIFFFVLLVLYIIAGILTYKSIFSVLPIVAAITYLYAIYYCKELTIKSVSCGGYVLWLIYNICILSVVGIVSNIVAIISTAIAIYRHNKGDKTESKKITNI